MMTVAPGQSRTEVDERGSSGSEATSAVSEPGEETESIQPAKIVRIGSMVRQLLDEAKSAPLDEASRARLREIYELSISELAEAVSPDLARELQRMTSPFAEAAPSESELRIAQAQLVGWLEGLFHGIQAAVFAQEIETHEQRQALRP